MTVPRPHPARARRAAGTLALRCTQGRLFAALSAGAAAALLVASSSAGAQSLRGSKASIARMHDQAQAHGLYFYETAAGAREAAGKGHFERLSGNADYTLHQVGFPFVTEETRLFVERLASQYRAACGEQLVVTSALRPSTRQPVNSTDLSVHPTGMAVDLRRPTGTCLTWLRTTLLALEEEGVLEATEERRPPHFHVAVFPRPYSRYLAGGATTKLASAQAPAAEEAAPAPARTTTRAAAVRRHRVRSGDTLWHLARRYGTTVRQIQRANNLSGSKLKPGQRIVIPGA